MALVKLTEEQLVEVWQDYKKDLSNQELRNTLMERYLPLVRYNAERVWAKLPDGVDLNDLISAGVFGLMDAIEAFDMERGVKFETYCVPRIRGAMLDEQHGERQSRSRPLASWLCCWWELPSSSN